MITRLRRLREAPPEERVRLLALSLKARLRTLADFSPLGTKKRFERMSRGVHPQTLARHREISGWAEEQSAIRGDSDPLKDDLVAEHHRLMESLRDRFHHSYAREGPLRLLLHLPAVGVSIAGYSVMRNLMDGFSFLGVPVKPLVWDQPLQPVLEDFRPSMLLTSWHPTVLAAIDWEMVSSYRRSNAFVVGLIAAEEELEGRTVVTEVLRSAQRLGVDFFYKEDPDTYLDQRYERYRDLGFPIVSLGYGANPFIYAPLVGVDRDLAFVFMGSAHRDKWRRYTTFFSDIFGESPGFLLGPGWPTGPPATMGHETHRYLYARGRVGLNLHHERQLTLPLELNERTYNLAVAGIPQLTDCPPLLAQRFDLGSLYVAESPSEYKELFHHVLRNPDEARVKALDAMKEAMSGHTVVHRASEAVARFVDLGLA